MLSTLAVAALGMALAACGGPAPAPAPRDAPGEPTWAADVAPIVYRHCAACHRPGNVAPFPLLDYDQVRARARLIAEMTSRRLMPPFLPEPGYASFRNARGLSPEEIETLAAWARIGAPAGDLAAAPDPPVFSDDFELGAPDLVAEMPAPFEVPAEGGDLYRNFLVPLPVPPGSRIRALEVDPGNRGVVHHAAVLADTTGTAHRLDGHDGRPGYDEMVGGSAPGGHFVGWTPGRGAIVLEQGMPWQVEEGTDLVVQLHLLPSGRPESVRARVGLWLTDAPVERTPSTVHLLATTLDIPAGEERFAAADELVLPVEVLAYSIYPHAHFLGREVRAWAELPDGATEPLLWIKSWSFDWQDEYGYLEPVRLPAGSRLRLELVYDNSEANARNPNRPPRRVTWGPSSHDEMGDAWLKVVPVDDRDRPALEQTLRRHERERYRAGYELRVLLDPADGDAHARLGIGYVQDGRYREAVVELERARALLGEAWDVDYNLGVALSVLGRPDQAIASYRRALAVDPGDARTLNALGGVLLAQGAVAESVEHYRRAVEARPGSADLRSNLGLAQQRAGDPEGAEASYREALRLDPGHRLAQSNYGGLLSELGRDHEAVAWFRAVLDADPDRFEAHVNLARSLARLGSAEEAQGHLRRALELRPGDGGIHYLLGLTLVQAGQAGDAVVELERALELDPGNVLARLDLAQVLLVEGEPRRALERLRPSGGAALEGIAAARYLRARALLALGQRDAARAELEATLRIDPRHDEAAAQLRAVR